MTPLQDHVAAASFLGLVVCVQCGVHVCPAALRGELMSTVNNIQHLAAAVRNGVTLESARQLADEATDDTYDARTILFNTQFELDPEDGQKEQDGQVWLDKSWSKHEPPPDDETGRLPL